MPNKSKRKGNTFERELVQQAQAAGVEAYRCWGSDGRSRGLVKDVDLVLAGSVKLQAKRKTKLPGWLGLTDGIDGVVLRQDHGESVVVLRWADYLALLSRPSRSDRRRLLLRRRWGFFPAKDNILAKGDQCPEERNRNELQIPSQPVGNPRDDCSFKE
jgi:hypothetical protein